LVGLRLDANAALDDLCVMIVGVGAVGGVAARCLAHLQVGELRLVDRGSFKPASLVTQLITPADVGKPKAVTVARLCKDISPRTRVLAFDGALQQLALTDMLGAQVVIVAGDNLSLLHDAGQRCLRLGLKMIHAAVHGETLTAQCRTFTYAAADHPCPVCLFDAEEFRLMQEERVLSCEGFRGPATAAFGRSLRHTASLQPLCSLAGSMAALHAVRLALRLGSADQDTLLEVCAHTWRSIVTPIGRNPNCPCFHERFTVRETPRAIPDCTLTDLIRAARPGASNNPPPTVTVEGHRWIERGLCGCAQSRPVRRLVPTDSPVAGQCRYCRKPVHPQPFHSHETIPSSVLRSMRDRTLRSLGAPACRGVLVRHGTHAVFLTSPKANSRS
jgi:molybdopterin/thiamine biosynthesis adenylyltransferase